MAEPFPYEGISTRKLVLETAYYNVLTAYSREELFEAVQRFPNIDSVVIHSELQAFVPDRDVPELRKAIGSKIILVLATSEHMRCRFADAVIPSHDPQELLKTIKQMLGQAEEDATHGRRRT